MGGYKNWKVSDARVVLEDIQQGVPIGGPDGYSKAEVAHARKLIQQWKAKQKKRGGKAFGKDVNAIEQRKRALKGVMYD